MCMRKTKRGLAVATSIGRGIDGYTEFWRSCSCGVKYKTFKLCLLEKLKEICSSRLSSFFKAFWLSFSLSETPSRIWTILGFIQVTIRVWIISSWATSNPATCVYHIFSGLWFGFWSARRQAESHDSVNEVNFQKINISQGCINYSQSSWMDNTTFCISASIIFFAFKRLLEIKLVLWEVPEIKLGAIY